jgi:hypothetical protein
MKVRQQQSALLQIHEHFVDLQSGMDAIHAACAV